MFQSLQPSCPQVSGKNLLNRPPFRTSAINSAHFYVEFFCPFVNSLSFALERNFKPWLRLLSVLCLRLIVCPSAIFRSVVPITINSIKRVVWCWNITHISQKILKRVYPSIAYFDSPAPVPMVSSRSSAITSILHRFPRSIFWRLGHSMRNRSRHSYINCKAAATAFFRSLYFMAERVRSRQCVISTITSAFPDNLAFSSSTSKKLDNQTAKSFASKVQNSVIEFRKSLRFSMIYHSHCVFLVRKGFHWLEAYMCSNTCTPHYLYPIMEGGANGKS